MSCYYSSALGRNICDEPIEQSTTVETLNSFSITLGLIIFLIGLEVALILLVVRYWNGSRHPNKFIFNKPMNPAFLGSIALTIIGFILVVSGNELSLANALSFIVIQFLVFLSLMVTLVLLTARYAMRVATRTGHSRVGFIWLSVFSPGLALIICLILDKDKNRYMQDGQDSYKLES